ncbi:MAG: gas vesicle protein [Methanothrix sp.]|nr:gas vesicle protein [Methanothrix sp.]MCX8206349.1 gas vesicle protein [Methanothrix sp.]
MEPERHTNAGLVDLLDRILTKGVVLNADIIISVAGVPLLGLNLRAALAGMDTMIRYGIWNEWDAAQRAWAAEQHRLKALSMKFLLKGEEIRLRTFGTYWYSHGIYQTWRPGDVCVTNRRIIVCRKEPPELLFAACYEDIQNLALKKGGVIANGETDILHICLKDGTVAKIHSAEIHALRDAAERAMCTVRSLQDADELDAEHRTPPKILSTTSATFSAKSQMEYEMLEEWRERER